MRWVGDAINHYVQRLYVGGSVPVAGVDFAGTFEGTVTYCRRTYANEINAVWLTSESSPVRRAARGELHDARHPLDPILMGSLLSFIIGRAILDAGDTGDLVGEHDLGLDNVLRVKRQAEAGQITAGMEPVTIAAYRVAPERMKRARLLRAYSEPRRYRLPS